MKRKRKKYEDLTIRDDFMFGKVMRHPERCRKLLEIILGTKISKVVFLDSQSSMNPDYTAKGIRLDIYLEDAENSVYNVEMQTKNITKLPKRVRYYQSVIDIHLIEKGADYDDLKDSYIIFICTSDMFGGGRHIYHFANLCKEDPSIVLDDGMEKIFLNVKGINETAAISEHIGEDLRNLLKYFESTVPQDAYTGELEKAVAEAKTHKEWRREYMKLEVMRWDSIREGRKEGEKIGTAKGRAEGATAALINLVYRKVLKGKPLEEIAEDLEDTGEIKRIYDTVVKYLSDYDPDKILAELNGRK